ncbi:MAG: hypothetical protein CVT75_06280 [Alphaproteobacteria bacterium HGW-Alphaproteobacteria-14]|nr:MAG: hypothetical protein CVT75_06280 [Alphaproteobacteria bacterium HGW-Alphaproteobacteria-14]
MAVFKRFISGVCAATLVAGLTVSAATAQEPDTQPESIWSHDLSGLMLPATLAGFERGQSKQFDKDGYNVGVAFKDDASGSWADLFIYRASPASVPIWGDRAVAGMFANPVLGEVDVDAVRIMPFTPPNNAGEKSGLKVLAPLQNDLTASGLAMYMHDGWLIKLRMTSRKLDIVALEARMADFIAGLKLSPAARPAPTFVDILDCPTPLKPGKKARLIQLDMMGSIMLGATLGAAHEEKAEADNQGDDSSARDSVWCRDPASQPQFGIYRRGADEDSYLIALGDVGTSLAVGRYDLGPLMKPTRGYLVTQSDGVTEQVYPPFDRLPLPGQVLGLPGNVDAVFSAGLMPGNNTGTTIMVPGG